MKSATFFISFTILDLSIGFTSRYEGENVGNTWHLSSGCVTISPLAWVIAPRAGNIVLSAILPNGTINSGFNSSISLYKYFVHVFISFLLGV